MKARELRRVFCLVLASVACCSKTAGDKVVVVEGRPPYREIMEGCIKPEDVARVWAGFPYDSISLDCWCGWLESKFGCVVFHRGGRAEMQGPVNGVWGDYEGTIDLFDYGRLCYALEQLDFERMKDRYSNEAFDVEECTLTTTSPHGTKTVVDHGGVGPIKLWTLRAAIDSVRAGVRWEKAKGK
jgi:hypothetical protein